MNSRKDNRLTLLLTIAGVIALCLSLGGWYWYAQSTFDEIVSHQNAAIAEYETSYGFVFDTDLARSRIRFTDLESYVLGFGSVKSRLDNAKTRLSDGTFWHSDERKDRTEEIEEWFKKNIPIHLASKTAVAFLKPIEVESRKSLDDASSKRTEAIASLIPQTDVTGFSRHSRMLAGISQQLEEVIKELRENPPDENTLAGILSKGVINDINLQLADENEAVKKRIQTLEYASKSLQTYKSELKREVGGGSGIIRMLNKVTRDFYPGIRNANRQVQPVRRVLRELDKPILGNLDPGRIVSSLFGGSSRKSSRSTTPLSLIKSVDPATGHSIETIKSACVLIETLDRSMKDLLRSTQPYLDASRRFSSTNSRSEMQTLLASGGPVKSFFDSQMNIFDPITDKLDEARGALRKLNAAARQFPLARQAVSNVTQTANDMIRLASRPVDETKEILGSSSKLITRLDEKEQAYQRVLTSLKSPDPEILNTPLEADLSTMNKNPPGVTSYRIYEVYNAAKDTPDDPYLNLRAGPGSSNTLIAKMNDGSALKVLKKGLGKRKRWWKVYYLEGEKTGYAHSKWIRLRNDR